MTQPSMPPSSDPADGRFAAMIAEHEANFLRQAVEFVLQHPGGFTPADFVAIQGALMQAGFAMTDEPPRGNGYGYYEGITVEGISELLSAAQTLPMKTRQRLALALAP